MRMLHLLIGLRALQGQGASRAFPAHLESLEDSHGCDFVIPS